MARFRTVIRDDRFQRELDKIEPRTRLADEAIEGLEWILARDPERGVPIGPEPVRAIPIYTLGPDLLVYYVFDESSVTLLSVIEADV